MTRLARSLLLLPLLLPLGAAAVGRDQPGQDPEIVAAEKKASLEATLLTLGQLDQRLTVPVAVGGRGPYNFIIDTGAERTVVSRELAGSLDLVPDRPVILLSMTGTSTVDTVVVPDLSIKSIGRLHTVIAPSLEGANLGAAGLLGIDTLQNHQVSIDFETGQMTVRPSEKHKRASRGSDEIVVTAKSIFGQLIVTDAYYGSTRVQVVLDTGSQITLGNEALRRHVAKKSKGLRSIKLTSVTGGQMMADYTQISDMKVGDVLFTAMPIAFADVAPFRRFGLSERPAILMGMDSLRNFRRVDIDFPNRQVRFTMPRNPNAPNQSGRDGGKRWE